MDLVHLAAELDPKILPIVEDWDRMKPPLQNAVNLVALCRAHGVDEELLIAVVGQAALCFLGDPSILNILLTLPDVVLASARSR
jgi:hypothetical protein